MYEKRRRNLRKENIKTELPKKYKIILIVLLTLIGIGLFLFYGIKLGGFESLLYDLKQSGSVLKYILAIFLIYVFIVIGSAGPRKVIKETKGIYNGSTYDVVEVTHYIPKTNKEKEADIKLQQNSEGCMKYAVLIVLGIFALLVILSLLEFLLPVILVVVVLILLYFLIKYIMLKILNRKK